MSKTIKQLIDHFRMQAHPEGGYFVETYKSDLLLDTPRGKRAASTAIHFLITKDSISHLHRLRSDEGWHYHLGEPLFVIEITPDGKLIETRLGPNFEKGEKLQHIVPAGHWFASTSTGEYSLVGCTVSPGFEFEDFELAKYDELSKEFPHLDNICKKYCLN